ncbi:hypothetical protein [Paraburkholderia sp. BCC1886]|uniref:hypothetical protein n=1 Tax=Paraburkholderia sp. BCC1886 TaxID=2562670 RepID=UPI0011840E10|nr:hypothetical protein [Paraburkholderia sp. BCC1886]
MDGKLYYAISVVFPDGQEGWLNPDMVKIHPFGEYGNGERIYKVQEMHLAVGAMVRLRDARFEGTGGRQLDATWLTRKIALIGTIARNNARGFSVTIRRGVKLRLWKVMISTTAGVVLKERVAERDELPLLWHDNDPSLPLPA